jgi:hypothetical protein
MSLSDYIKYLRAVNGGLTPWEIAEGSGVPAREIHLLEVKHRRMGENEAMLQKLADYFKVQPQELTRRRDAYRKRLTAFLDVNSEEDESVVLLLEGGEEVSGKIVWYGREAVAIQPQQTATRKTILNEPYIVQRGWVADWRRADNAQWEVASG